MICLVAGAAIVLIQSFWITYGVFVRYALGNPDGMVTEATALLLVPLAFLGLPWALRGDAFPRVEFPLRETSTARCRRRRENPYGRNGSRRRLLCQSWPSTRRSARIARAPRRQVLEWPEYLFWAPVAFAAIAFRHRRALSADLRRAPAKNRSERMMEWTWCSSAS
jgi:hypothetical protein